MATQYQVNIKISAGVDFTQKFFLTNSDQSPLNLTGFSFSASMAKHAEAVNATSTTSSAVVWKAIPFTTAIVDAAAGSYSISLPSTTTAKLEEGKYVYSIVMTDNNGDRSEILKGLVFVSPAFGYIDSLGTLDPNYP